MEYLFFCCDNCGYQLRLGVEIGGATLDTGMIEGESDIPNVFAYWPDGTVSQHRWSRLTGLQKQTAAGDTIRPSVLTCNMSLDDINHEASRKQIREHFRRFHVHVPS